MRAYEILCYTFVYMYRIMLFFTPSICMCVCLLLCVFLFSSLIKWFKCVLYILAYMYQIMLFFSPSICMCLCLLLCVLLFSSLIMWFKCVPTKRRVTHFCVCIGFFSFVHLCVCTVWGFVVVCLFFACVHFCFRPHSPLYIWLKGVFSKCLKCTESYKFSLFFLFIHVCAFCLLPTSP